MKAKPEVEDDPVVAEVRRIRADLWRVAGGTVAGLLQLLEARESPKRRPQTRKRGGSVAHPQSGNASTA